MANHAAVIGNSTGQSASDTCADVEYFDGSP